MLTESVFGPLWAWLFINEIPPFKCYYWRNLLLFFQFYFSQFLQKKINMKIAVVGSGISGLSAAYFLSKKHKVDLFEKENRFGGHSHTTKIIYEDMKEIEVDIGFMVFNKHTYPNLINFFLENNIEIEKSDMSFSVCVQGTKY